MSDLQWYLSFHGGSDSSDWNNIHAYTRRGKEANPSKILNKDSLPSHIKLRELRGMVMGPDQNLYVVNAYKDYSQVLQFSGELNSDGQHDFLSEFVSEPGSHPFEAIFDPVEQNLYVSNQDTLNVTRYYGPNSNEGQPGSPIGDGVFIGSGLSSVRGIAFDGMGRFYVVDETADTDTGTGCINVYDAQSGDFISTLPDPNEHLDQPVHIVIRENVIYIGNSKKNNLCCFDLANPQGVVEKLISKSDANLDAPSGLAFDQLGRLYVCSRKGEQVNRYLLSDDGLSATFDEVFIGSKLLEDNPEFIMLFGDPTQETG